MRLLIKGRRPKKVSKLLIREVVSFAIPLLMSKRLLKTLKLQVVFIPNLLKNEKNIATCEILENPKHLRIRLDPAVSKRNCIKNILHELVHVKQYATGQMKEYIHKPIVRYHGKYYLEDEGEKDYWDSPWEIDAYGREYGLYYRWDQYLTKKKK